MDWIPKNKPGSSPRNQDSVSEWSDMSTSELEEEQTLLLHSGYTILIPSEDNQCLFFRIQCITGRHVAPLDWRKTILILETSRIVSSNPCLPVVDMVVSIQDSVSEWSDMSTSGLEEEQTPGCRDQ